jgi:hypothetical protein
MQYGSGLRLAAIKPKTVGGVGDPRHSQSRFLPLLVHTYAKRGEDI